jgi:hypothetical protein
MLEFVSIEGSPNSYRVIVEIIFFSFQIMAYYESL